MRSAALDCKRGSPDARRRKAHIIRLDAAALERDHQIVFLAQARDTASRTRRSDFFVGIDQHRQFTERVHLQRRDHPQRVENHCDPRLVIGDAQTVGLAVFDPKWLARQVATLVDRVHVRDQRDLRRAAALDPRKEHRAGAIVWRGCDDFERHARCGELGLDHRTHPGQPFKVAAAGFDLDKLLQGLQRERFLQGSLRSNRFAGDFGIRLTGGQQARAKEHHSQPTLHGFPSRIGPARLGATRG